MFGVYLLGEPMTFFDKKVGWASNEPLLLPAAFRWRDPATQLVHHGAVIKRRDGHVLGFTVLCTEVLGPDWDDPMPNEDADINCLQCLGAREQDA
jgi:hypothetical protein